MNTSRLLEIVELLLSREAEFKVQEALNHLNSMLSVLVNEATQAGHQQNYAAALDRLAKVTAQMHSRFEPAQMKFASEIGANPYFVEDLAKKVGDWVRENPIAPAVPQKHLSELISKRETYLNQLKQLKANLSAVGVSVQSLEPGDAELGFMIPRDIFDNSLLGLAKELENLVKAIRPFSEVTTGSVDDLKVRQISTSDPLIFLGIPVVTVIAIGRVVTWALQTWKTLEEIRKIRAETQKINSFSKKEIDDFFETKIRATIESSVQEMAGRILKDYPERDGRRNELDQQLQKSLNWIFAHLERGATIEIRHLPPTAPQDQTAEKDGSPEAAANAKQRVDSEELMKISRDLVFPRVQGTPVLQIPSLSDAASTTSAKKSK